MLSVGVNSPPDAPLPRQTAVTRGLRADRAISRLKLLRLRKAPYAMSLPFPSNSGYQMLMIPRTPKASTGANRTLTPVAR